jgi:dihydroorotase-like cyclic amidohydrolase
VGIDDGIIYMGFREIGKLDFPGVALVHAENIEVFFKLKDEFIANNIDPDWNDTRPNFNEVESIRRVVAFAKATGCALLIVHLSTKEAQEELLRARAEGVTIYGETCPQYLTLTTKNSDRILAKVNPPIRTAEDNEGLWDAIRNDVITMIGSDHAACATKHKQEFWSAVVGFAGIQLLLPIILSEGVNKGKISINKAAAITSYNAAKVHGMYPRKGAIEVGSDADLTVVDLNLEKEVHAKDLLHISDFTPFEGWKLKGWPVATFVRGKQVMKDGAITGDKGYGQVIRRRAGLRK